MHFKITHQNVVRDYKILLTIPINSGIRKVLLKIKNDEKLFVILHLIRTIDIPFDYMG